MTTTSSTTNSSGLTGTLNQTASGRNYITGAITGLDTNSLIQSAVNQRLTGYNQLETEISTNTSEISAYNYLQSYAQSLQTAISSLKSTTDSAGNTLTSKTGTFTTSDGSTSSNLVTATVSATALSGTHTLVVDKLATAMSVTSAAQSSTGTALGYTGTFDIALDGKTAATISVNPDMSLGDLQQAINNLSATTGVSADIAQVGNGQYKLVLTGTSTNANISVSNVTGDDVMQQLGVTASDGSFANVAQTAGQAQFSLDGTTIYSDSNTVSNVLTGVTLNLVNANPNTTLTMTVGSNTSGISTAINNFITAYNTLRNYIASQQNVDTSTGTVSSSAVLFNESIMRDFSHDVSGLLSTSYGSGTINSLGALGISLDDNNNLELSDSDTLNDALTNNLSSIQQLFATQFTSSSTNLTLAANSSNLNGTYTVAITTDGNGNITGASVNGDSNAFTIDGNQLVGKTGTAYAGLTLQYDGSSSANVQVTFSQGLGDALYNTLDSYANTDSGIIANRVDQLQTQNTDMTTQASQLYQDAQDYQDQLIDKYSQMETAALNAQLLKQQIDAILNGDSSSSSSS